MKLEFIECQNFFNHKYTKLDFLEIGSPVLVTGENGAGKTSSIVEPLTFAIFGQTRLANIDDAIRNDENEMAVAVKFNLSGQDIEIIRSKKRGKTAKLELIVDGIPVDELLTETQVKINKLFGLSYNSFLSSIILKQEDADFFVRQKPDERKKIIGEILDLNAYERIEKLAREERTVLGREIKGEEALLRNVHVEDESELLGKLKTITGGLKKLEKSLNEAREILNDKIKWNAGVEAQINAREEALQRNKNIQVMISGIREKLINDKKALVELQGFEQPGDITEQVTTLETNISAREELLNEYDTELRKHRNLLQTYTRTALDKIEPKKEEATRIRDQHAHEAMSIKSRMNKIQGLKVAECPTCLQPIDTKTIAQTIEHMQAEFDAAEEKRIAAEAPVEEINKLITFIKSAETKEAKQFQSIIDKYEAEIPAYRQEIAQNRAELKLLISTKQSYELAQERATAIYARIGDNEKHVTELENQILSIPEVTLELKPISQDQTAINAWQAQLQQAIKLQSQLEASIEQTREAMRQREQLTKTLATKIHKLALLDKIVNAFSRRGIPASIIETVLPEIQEIANIYLSRMSQGTLSLEFKTTQLTKSGEERDTLDVNVYDGKNWRAFDSFSGGEKFRISLSIRLALSKVLTRRAGVELELLILDEPAAPLDETGREIFYETIMSLRQDFSKIIVMSHLPGLTDEIEDKIHLKKSPDGTKLVSAA